MRKKKQVPAARGTNDRIDTWLDGRWNENIVGSWSRFRKLGISMQNPEDEISLRAT